jgi:hypothetical protein
MEWYSDARERVLGTVQFFFEDEDWCWTILARDGNGRFRAIDCKTSIASRESARAQLEEKLLHHAQDGDAEFLQGDERKHTVRLFEPMVPVSRFHPLFNLIHRGAHHSAARAIMQEIANAFEDVDGNYVKDFQTTGFNARLWELFLFAFLYEQHFSIVRDFDRPDYCAMKMGIPLAIEAVTVNPTADGTLPAHVTPEEQQLLCKDFLPIKFGSALYSKLKKRYWELSHMAGRPFALAVHDFMCDDSMTWSTPAISDYLYGTRASWWKDASGKLHIEENPIETHHWGAKVIPSGFFRQPNADWIGAVLISNSATISKFNRIGKLAGFGDPNVVMMRIGERQDFDPNAEHGILFKTIVDPAHYSETWSESVRVFHNPNARIPIPEELLPGCSHHYWRNGRRVAMVPKTFVHHSKTLVVAPADNWAQ